MTNPTLERAARALYRADPENYGTEDDMWSSYVEQARAVLMAVREPDEVMVKAANDREEEIVDTYGCVDPTGGFNENGPSVCFTAMIDAILNDGEGE